MKLLTLVSAGLVILGAVGCFQVDVNVIVNPDGSGKIKQSFGLSKEAFADFEAMLPPSKTKTPEAENKEMEKKFRKLAASFGPGVAFESLSREARDGFIYFNAVYTFTDVSKIRIDPKGGSMMSEMGASDMFSQATGIGSVGFTMARAENGDPILIIKSPLQKPDAGNKDKKAPAKPDIFEDDTEDGKPAEKEPPQDDMSAMNQYLKNMRISCGLTLGSEIVETNAAFREQNRIIYLACDGNKLLASQDKWKQLFQKYAGVTTPDNATIRKAMEEFSKLSDGAFKVEMQDEIKVQFK